MKLAVASYRGLSLVDTVSSLVEPLIDIPKPWSPYGISWNKDNLFVSVGHNGPEGKWMIKVYDRGLKFVRDLTSPELKDVHQIMWYDNKLWAVASGLNQIVIFDNEEIRLWQPNPKHPNLIRESRPPEDWNHFNSIWFESSRVYLVAHNFDRPSEIWKFTYPGLKKIKVIRRGTMTHNVCRIDGKLETLSSIVSLKWGYGRGLAVNDNNIFIGRSDEIKDKKARKLSQGAIMVFDRQKNLERTIPINLGEVYETRILDGEDLAHHNQPWI